MRHASLGEWLCDTVAAGLSWYTFHDGIEFFIALCPHRSPFCRCPSWKGTACVVAEQNDRHQNQAGRWTPELHFRTMGGRCRLWLGSYVYGDGDTLQEAADDLVARTLLMAQHMRGGAGYRFSSELPPPDVRWLELLYEVGEMARRGEDIRARLFDA